jgi:hypothetical protein
MEFEMFKSGWIFGLALLASCGVDIQSGSQHAGQSCFVPSDCSDGLTCFERICVPMGTAGPNTSNNNNNNMLDVGLDSTTDSDVPACVIGSRVCVSENLAEICVSEGNVATVVRIDCTLQEFCDSGVCVSVGECVDEDGDGYGAGCDQGPDCDDGNNRINPGARENCTTMADDNCDRVVNEGCNFGACCAGGCNDSQFCNTECACQEFLPDVCKSQNQPCLDIDSFVNGYYCVALGASEEGRCYGVCSTTAMDPDSTCPDPNTVCALGDPGDSSALCVSNCTFDQGCGDPGLGCLPYDVGQTEGVCLPTNPNNPIGSSCDPDQFLDCASGGICVPRQNGNGGVCREACRPFAHANGSATTDCNAGHCFAYSADIGVCLGDNMATEGEQCRPQFSMCNEDAVACFPSQNGTPRCQRVCRLGLSDCDPGLECFQFDPQQEDLGVCILLE